MTKPIDLFIVGAQKSGTTSLLNYLGEHADVVSHPQQEMSYFVSNPEYAAGYEAAYERYFAHASSRKPNGRVLVAKHASLCHKEHAIQRLWEHNADCKLVIILRNPVDRALSSYLMERKKWGEAGSFERVVKEAIHDPGNWRYRAYLEFGMYERDLSNMIRRFGREALTVVFFGDLKANPSKVSQRVFSTLGVDAAFCPQPKIHNQGGTARSALYARLLHEHLLNRKSPVNKFARQIVPPHHAAKFGAMLRRLNQGSKKDESMSPEMRAFLVEFYRPHNARLSELLGQDLSHWDR